MSGQLLAWIAALIMQSALLGRAMFAVRGAGARRATPPRRAAPPLAPRAPAPPCRAAAPAHHAARHRRAPAPPQLMSLSDLENDFLNPYDLCNRLNRFVVRRRARTARRAGAALGRRWGAAAGPAAAGPAAAGAGRDPSGRELPPPTRALSPPPTPRTQGLEYGAQAALALMLVLSGNWFAGACHLAILGYMVHLWAGNKVYVDATDVFRQLPDQKRQKLALLGGHTVLFMLVVYRWGRAGRGGRVWWRGGHVTPPERKPTPAPRRPASRARPARPG
jgi:hypothetical protein